MKLFDDFFSITRTSKKTVLILAGAGILSGAANAAILAIVGESLRQSEYIGTDVAPGLFVLAALLYLVFHRYSQARTAREVERTSAKIRTRILDGIFHASAINNERVDHHFKQLVLSRDTTQVSAALPAVVMILSSLTTVACALGYLLWVSPVSAAIIFVVIVMASFLYEILIRRTGGKLRDALVENDRAFGFVDDLLRGYKELKLDSIWAREFIHDDMVPAVKCGASKLGNVRAAQQDINLIGLSAFLLLLGLATFLSSSLGTSNDSVVNTVLVLMFIQAHVYGIMQRLPALVEMSQAARRIRELESRLGGQYDRLKEDAQDLGEWSRLSLRNIGFSYPDSDNKFQLEEINLTIQRGQTVFIVGGNGSGKTTLAKLLLGLYKPSEGAIYLDDTAIDDGNRTGYRHLFNAVFSDVHLFRRRVTGVLEDTTSAIHRVLEDMSIKLAFSEDNRLSVAPFSQGQKKRLASALALTNGRPLCLFDEWTADQDPEFRSYFYHSYLPCLKAEGKTLFVITHDDRYFNHADIVLRLDSGKVISIESGKEP